MNAAHIRGRLQAFVTRVKHFIAGSQTLALYALAAGLPALANFCSTPLLLRSLGIQGFGRWALIEPLLLMGSSLLLLGSQYGGMQRRAVGEGDARTILSCMLLPLTITTPLATMLACIGLATGILPASPFPLITAMLTDASAACIGCILRAEKRPLSIALTESIKSCGIPIWAAISLLPGVALGHTVDSTLLARSLAFAVVMGGWGLLSIGLSPPSIRLTRGFLVYGAPILGAQVFLIAATNLDRYIIQFAGLGHSGLTVYVVHSRLAGVLNVAIAAPLALWFPIEAMRRDSGRDRGFFNLVFVALVLMFTLLSIIMPLVAPFFWRTLFPGTRLDPELLVLCLASVFFQSASIVWNVGALRPGRTAWNLVPTIAFFVSVVILTPVGVKLGGITGLAGAKAISVGVYAITFRMISQRFSPLHTPARLVVPFYIAAAGSLILPAAFALGALSTIVVGLVIVAALTSGIFEALPTLSAHFASRRDLTAGVMRQDAHS